MRVIEAFDKPIRTVALSPDGRFVAAATEHELVVCSWDTGEKTSGPFAIRNVSQLAFRANGTALVYAIHQSGVFWISPTTSPNEAFVGAGAKVVSNGSFAGGVAVSPDGKTLVATHAGHHQRVKLNRWSLPTWRPLTGFDFWSPFQRLAFSPNGEFLAGINRVSFELRIAVTGGLNGRQQPRDATSTAFLTFPRHGDIVVFGWDKEFRVMETRAGNVLMSIASPGKPFVDAAFTGSGRHLSTVDGTDVMRVWSADSWEVIRGYDWRAGGLTCIAAATDGLTGVCGTNSGRLIAFDVDE
jgi:hypothetical protein